MASHQDREDQAYQKALQIGRPPNIVKLFPESQALIVSGKYIDMAMLAKGRAIAMAANGRNAFVIRGALLAAQQANACLIVEIARSEGGASAYCAVNYWNIALDLADFGFQPGPGRYAGIQSQVGQQIEIIGHVGGIDGNRRHAGLEDRGDFHARRFDIRFGFDTVVIGVDGHWNGDAQFIAGRIHLAGDVPIVDRTVC